MKNSCHGQAYVFGQNFQEEQQALGSLESFKILSSLKLIWAVHRMKPGNFAPLP